MSYTLACPDTVAWWLAYDLAARVRAFRHALWPLSAMFGVRL